MSATMERTGEIEGNMTALQLLSPLNISALRHALTVSIQQTRQTRQDIISLENDITELLSMLDAIQHVYDVDIFRRMKDLVDQMKDRVSVQQAKLSEMDDFVDALCTILAAQAARVQFTNLAAAAKNDDTLGPMIPKARL